MAALVLVVGAMTSAALAHLADMRRMRRTEERAEVFRAGVASERRVWEQRYPPKRPVGRRFPGLDQVRATYVRLHTEPPASDPTWITASASSAVRPIGRPWWEQEWPEPERLDD